MRTYHLALVFALVVTPSFSQAPPTPQPGRINQDFTIAATGDSIITRAISVDGDARFSSMVDLIRSASIAFTNLEGTLIDLRDFQGYPAAEAGGNWVSGPTAMADELKWAGFTLFSRANNHTTDFGIEGMLATDNELAKRGLTYAGTGLSMGEARAAAYRQTTYGRVALISIASTFMPMSRAGATRPDIKGRPGMNALRTEQVYVVDAGTMAQVKALQHTLGQDPAGGDDIRFLGTRFKVGSPTGPTRVANETDMAAILANIRNARRQSDFLVVTIHAHESGRTDEEPAAFLPLLARASIDAGADIFIGHGPHFLRAIEIYKERPIFYSLGNFIFQNDTIEPSPSDFYEQFGLGPHTLMSELFDVRYRNDTTGFPARQPVWESVVATSHFKDGRLAEVRLHPIDLGFRKPRSQRGTPRLADAELGQTIIERLQRLSQSYGTRIQYENGIGLIRSASGN